MSIKNLLNHNTSSSCLVLCTIHLLIVKIIGNIAVTGRNPFVGALLKQKQLDKIEK